MNRDHYESDAEAFKADAYTVRGYSGIAFHVYGWETEPVGPGPEWAGIEGRTGRVIAVMVGDDAQHAVNLEDIAPLECEAYCGSCGQIGCTHRKALVVK